MQKNKTRPALLSYYRHSRSLGAFRAIDCYYLARAAADLDAARPVAPPALVCSENGQRLSFAIKMF
jgi:hypothetical protein